MLNGECPNSTFALILKKVVMVIDALCSDFEKQYSFMHHIVIKVKLLRTQLPFVNIGN